MKRNTAWRQKRLQQLHSVPFSNLTENEQMEKKRLIQLEKNRKAAANSRLKRKQYLSKLENEKKSLEHRLYILEMENNQLRAVLQAWGFTSPILPAPATYREPPEEIRKLAPSIFMPPPPPPPGCFDNNAKQEAECQAETDADMPPMIIVEESGTILNTSDETDFNQTSDTASTILPLSLSYESGNDKETFDELNVEPLFVPI